VHKLSRTIAIMGLLAPLGANALGIGDIRLHSTLNQSFDAEIPLVLSGEDTLEDVKITLAPPEAFAKAGVERHSFLNRLQFSAFQKPNGSYAIRVSSRDAITEPFMNFLVEVDWPQGKVLREFTVLLDPPATTPERTVAEPSVPYVARRTRPYESTAETAEESTPVQRPSPEPAEIVKPQFTDTEYGPVQRNETLWNIARTLNQDPTISQDQMVTALLRSNPRAFRGSSPNTLLAGSILRIPDHDTIVKLAGRRVRVDLSGQPQPGAGRLSARKTAQARTEAVPSAEEEAPQLKLLPEGAAKTRTEDAVSGGETGTGKDRAKTDLALEIAGKIKQENEELKTRLEQFEKQLAEMQRLLTLKNEEISTLQTQQRPPAPPAATVPAPTPVPPVAQPPAAEPPAVQPPPAVVPQPAGTEPPAATVQPAPKIEPPVVQPPQPAPPKPKPTPKPAPTPPVAAAEPGFLEDPLGHPLQLLAGFGGLALAGAGWLYYRRRTMIAETESILIASERENLQKSTPSVSVPTAAPRLDAAPEPLPAARSSFLSEFTPSDFDALGTETDEVDPISEADVYLAYGRYKQAEELIRHAIEQNPERDECKLKLLEIHYATENRRAFQNYAWELKQQGADSKRDFWDKVLEMGRELLPDNPLFQEASPVVGKAPPQRPSFDTSKTLSSMDLSDDLIDDLKRFEVEFARSKTAPDEEEDESFFALDSEADSEAENFERNALFEDNAPEPEEQEEVFGQEAFTEKERAIEPAAAVRDADADAGIEFDLSALLRKPAKAPEPVREEPVDLENLISFDFETPKLPQEPQAQPGKTIDDILRELAAEAEEAQPEAEPEVIALDAEESGEAFSLEDELSALDLARASESVRPEPVLETENFYADLTDTDQLETKLDLAKAYADMEDGESARDILKEVLAKGNERQKTEAESLLAKLTPLNSAVFSMVEPRSSRL
jgi:pilus assembly protein FimV